MTATVQAQEWKLPRIREKSKMIEALISFGIQKDNLAAELGPPTARIV